MSPAGGQVCLVVPCAGHGRRLRVPWPKELLALGPDCTLLDAALAPFRAATGPSTRIVAVLAEHKLDTLKHLTRYQPHAEIAAVFQPDGTDSLADALRAALPFTTDRNALVLPDQLIGTDAEATAAVTHALGLLQSSPVSVLAHPMAPDELTADGAVRLSDGAGGLRATGWQDKPRNPAGFDAAWVSLFFTRQAGCDVADALDALGRGTQLDHPSAALVNAPVVLVPRYAHVSSWDDAAAVITAADRWRP